MASKANESPYHIDLDNTLEDVPDPSEQKRDSDGKFDEGGPGSGPQPDVPEQIGRWSGGKYNEPQTSARREGQFMAKYPMTEDMETPEDEDYGIYEEVPVIDDETRLENIPYVSDAGEYICPECGEKFYDIESYETHLPAKEDSLLKVDEEPEGVKVDVLDQWDNAGEDLSVAGPPAGDTIPANMIKDEENDDDSAEDYIEDALLIQLLNNELEEQAKGHDETEDIAIVTHLLEEEGLLGESKKKL
jgi:hypothetical protein